jgi:F0F1-type ATP synthase gamma subunit
VALLGELLPANVEVQVQRCLYESAAAEQAARMEGLEIAILDNLGYPNPYHLTEPDERST